MCVCVFTCMSVKIYKRYVYHEKMYETVRPTSLIGYNAKLPELEI